MNPIFQNFITIVLPILAPILGLLLIMWNHFNKRFDKVDEKFNKVDERFKRLNESLSEKIKHGDEKLGEKIDAVRDRISRIEGQLMPTKLVPFAETKSKEKLKAQG